MRRAGAHDGLSAQPLGYAPDGAGLVAFSGVRRQDGRSQECTEFISPATVDGERNSAHWVKVNNPNAPAVIRPLRVGEAE